MGTIVDHEKVDFGFDRAVITGRSYRPEVFVGPAMTSYVFQGGAVTCNVSAVVSLTTRLADFGDSGGPMIMYQNQPTNSGPAFAMGMILGGGNDGTGREVLFHETRMAIPPGWRLVTSA